jgi:hypothetical protein
MKSFSLNENHDIDIKNNEIQMVEGTALLQQSAELNLNTKAGEWFLDSELGIDMNSLLGKRNLDSETIKSIISDGLRQIDESFEIDTFNASFDAKDRKLSISSTASTSTGEKISIMENTKQGGVKKTSGTSVSMVDGGMSITGGELKAAIINGGFVVTGG